MDNYNYNYRLIKGMVAKYSHAWPYLKMKAFSPDEYARSLANLPPELVQLSFEKAKLTSEFFPTISKLREIAEGIVMNSSPEAPLTAEEAWYETMKRISRSETKILKEKYPLAYEVAVRFGTQGIQTLISMNECDESFNRTRYIKMYNEFLQREKDRKLDEELMAFMPKEKQLAFQGIMKNLAFKNLMITNPNR